MPPTMEESIAHCRSPLQVPGQAAEGVIKGRHAKHKTGYAGTDGTRHGAHHAGYAGRVGRADPGEEPNLRVEIVGPKPDSKRDVVIRVFNVGEQWSDVTKLTVETVSPTAGQRRTFDVGDINTVAEAPLPNSFDFSYTLAADGNNQVVKASLSAGKNYMGEQEINLDDNVVQGAACVTPVQAIQGPRLDPDAPTKPSPILNSRPAPAPEKPITLEWSSFIEETFFVTYGLPYEIRLRNNDQKREHLDIDFWVKGDATVPHPRDQPSGSFQAWTDAGFTCGIHEIKREKRVEMECGSGWIEPGATLTLRTYVKMTAQVGGFAVGAKANTAFTGSGTLEIRRKVNIFKL